MVCNKLRLVKTSISNKHGKSPSVTIKTLKPKKNISLLPIHNDPPTKELAVGKSECKRGEKLSSGIAKRGV